MEDLKADKDLGRILRHFHTKQRPTAVICHAPIALLSAQQVGSGFLQGLHRSALVLLVSSGLQGC